MIHYAAHGYAYMSFHLPHRSLPADCRENFRLQNLKRQDKRRNLYSFGGDSGTADVDEGVYDVEG